MVTLLLKRTREITELLSELKTSLSSVAELAIPITSRSFNITVDVS